MRQGLALSPGLGVMGEAPGTGTEHAGFQMGKLTAERTGVACGWGGAGGDRV